LEVNSFALLGKFKTKKMQGENNILLKVKVQQQFYGQKYWAYILFLLKIY